MGETTWHRVAPTVDALAREGREADAMRAENEPDLPIRDVTATLRH